MYYEVFFNQSTGRWRLRVSSVVLGLFQVYRVVMHEQPTARPMEFDTLHEARLYIERKGIPLVYAPRPLRTAAKYVAEISEGACHHGNC